MDTPTSTITQQFTFSIGNDGTLDVVTGAALRGLKFDQVLAQGWRVLSIQFQRENDAYYALMQKDR